MANTAIEAHHLTRSFRVRRGPDRTALDAVTLDLPAGGVHGLLGPNGAGKTTLCRIACTVLLPTSGSLRVHGHDVVRDRDEVRRLVGIVFGGDRGLYGRLTAAENLRFWCAMNGVPWRHTGTRVADLLARLGLEQRADDLVETFSRGMKQRLHLARGLVSDPPVLLLDEPTVGMDPVSAHDFRRLMTELRGEGRTILLTTHDMAEAQALCDTVTFIDGGRIVGSGTPGTVRAMLSEGGLLVRVEEVDTGAFATVRAALAPEVTATHDPRSRRAELTVPTDVEVQQVVATLVRLGHTAITTGPPSLEDAYLRLLGQGAGGTARGMSVG